MALGIYVFPLLRQHVFSFFLIFFADVHADPLPLDPPERFPPPPSIFLPLR